MIDKKIFSFIDIETTGFNVGYHDVIEVACVLVDPSKNYEIIDELELKIKPERIENADPQALRINGYNEAEWMFAYTLEQAMKMLAEKVENTVMVAHNITFDWTFLDHAFRATGIEPKFYRKLDSYSIAYAKFNNEPDINKFSLKALAEYYGLTNEKAHTALADTRVTVEIFRELMKR
jgi:DNA polymerase-3 subunit epsilon